MSYVVNVLYNYKNILRLCHFKMVEICRKCYDDIEYKLVDFIK